MNLYQDATTTLDGVRFEISGDYPVRDTVTVRVSRPVEVVFRKPAWCPRLDVSRDGDTYTLGFDMAPRVIHRDIVPTPEDEPSRGTWAFDRYADNAPQGANEDVRRSYRRTPAATVMRGPLLLARAQRAGATRNEIRDESTVNGLDCAVSLAPLPATETWGLWDMTLSAPERAPLRTRVCDFQSAGDDPSAVDADAFSIWF